MNYIKEFTLLYVEDDISIIELIEDLLKDNFKEVYIAKNGFEGLEKYKQHSPDIVLTDIVMPQKDGLDMSKEIKQINKNQKIVLLTAHDDKDNFIKSINIGIDKYILKPIVDIGLFLTQLESVAQAIYNENLRELESQIKQKEARLDAISSILNNIAHQYRQPLSIISATVGGIVFDIEAQNAKEIQEYSQQLESILKHTDYLSKVIEQSTALFSSNHNEKENICLKELIDELELHFKEELAKHGIKLIIDIDESYELKCDKLLFLLALQNIFINSIEVLSGLEQEDKIIYIGAQRVKENLSLVIKDNGKGIDEENLEKIFDPYFTTKHQYMGVGLSLYLSNQILKYHLNADVLVENEKFDIYGTEYYGAKFTLNFKVEV